MLAAAVVLDAAVGCGAVVAAPPAAAVVGLAAGAEVGAAAGADVGAGWVALGPQAAASNRTLPLNARVRNSRRVVILSPYLPQRCGGENTSLPKDTLAKPHALGSAAAALSTVASAYDRGACRSQAGRRAIQPAAAGANQRGARRRAQPG